MQYNWVEWDLWDGRVKRHALLERDIIFDKNKKNRMVSVFQAGTDMLDHLQKDIGRWNQYMGVYPNDVVWKPEVKILDEITTRSKITEIVGNRGELISFGHLYFEIIFGVKLL